MHTLAHVRYTPAESVDHFVDLFDRLLHEPQPVRRLTFGLNAPAAQRHEALMHTAPRFILGLRGNHTQLFADGTTSRQTPLRRHEALFFPPLGWNMPQWPGALEFLSVVFYPDYTRFVHGTWSGRGAPRVTFYHTPAATSGTCPHLVSALVAAGLRHAPAPGSCAMLEALLWELQPALVAARDSRPRKGQQTWQAMTHYVQEHLHEPLSLQMLADHFELHPNHISRQFRRTGHEGFVTYLTRLRMKRAEQFLAEGRSDIEGIALSCGFTDPGYFRRVFSRFFGQSPSDRLNRVPRTSPAVESDTRQP